VFIDQANLSASNDLPAALHTSLQDARFFIYLASTDAAQSRWIGEELRVWLSTHDSSHLLVVLTDGDLVWDEAGGSFDGARSIALHRELQPILRNEPLWIDLRWARKESTLSARDPRLQHATAMLAARLHGRELDDLIGEDLRHHQRARVWLRSAIGVFALLMVLIVVAAFAAVRTARALQNRLELLSSILPFNESFDNNALLVLPGIPSSLFVPITDGVQINWREQDRFVVSKEDCVFTGLAVNAEPPEECQDPGLRYGPEGLREDVPHLRAIALQLVADINSGRVAEVATSLHEEDSRGAELAERLLQQTLKLAPSLLSSQLWEGVHVEGKDERSSGWRMDRSWVSVFAREIAPDEGTELVCVQLQASGYCGSGGCSVATLVYLRRQRTYELVWLGDVDGSMSFFDQADSTPPRLFTVSHSQAGAYYQVRSLHRYEFSSSRRMYLHTLDGTIRAEGLVQ
jgi:hypothetical protein